MSKLPDVPPHLLGAILAPHQIAALRAALEGKSLAVSFGSGVDSTALLVALWLAGIVPDLITFADTGGEKKATLEHLARMNSVLARWGWPLIQICKHRTLPSTTYSDLYGNCMANQTLPSLAFGKKSCSIKWKQTPQNNLVKGVGRGPNKCEPHPIWRQYQATGRRIARLIGYDCGKADMRRSKNLPLADADFDYVYPLQVLGWARPDCIAAITSVLGSEMVPIKSACFYCPASKLWELFWLAAFEPDLLERALVLERRAMTGQHSRFKEETGLDWETWVRSGEPLKAKAVVGLGRSGSWIQWALANDVMDHNCKVKRGGEDRARFAYMADLMRRDDNALDQRTIRIHPKNQQAAAALVTA